MARLTVPGTTVSLLSSPGKMPCRSWSLPAVKSCPSAFFGKGAICGEDRTAEGLNCYASKRAYTWPVVVRALEARFAYAIRASMDAATGDEFVAIMTTAVDQEMRRQMRRHKRAGGSPSTFQAVFRVHDSGDLFSPAYANLWARVAKASPSVNFWFPTRQWRSKNPHMQSALAALAALDNVSVRPSALRFEDDAPIVLHLAAGTTASTNGYNCPASTQGNKCGDCRQCWRKDVVVSYHRH